MAAPDFITDGGVPVWLDITDEPVPCELGAHNVPTDYGQFACVGVAERRYGDYAACNYHFRAARVWAEADAADARAEFWHEARRELGGRPPAGCYE